LLELDHFHVDKFWEAAGLVEHVSDPSAHAGREISTRLAQDNRATTGHIFAAMIADALHHGMRTAIANAEPLPGHAAQVQFAASGPIQHNVSGDDVLLRGERGFARRVDDDLAARKSFSAVVVDIPFHADRYAVNAEGQQALPGRAF